MEQEVVYIQSPREFLDKQIEVFELCKKASFILYSGAFRAGKTLLLAQVAIITCVENPGCKGLLGSQTYPQLRDVVFSVFLQEVDSYQDELNKNGIDINLLKHVVKSDGKMSVEFYNGSTVLFRACDEERKLAGLTLDFFGLDEPVDIDEKIFTQLIGRISGTGKTKHQFGLLTTNPGSESNWVHKYFYDEVDEGFEKVETTTYDNVLLPNYHTYIAKLEKIYNEDWIRRYLNGNWGAFEGQIYKDFNPTKHVGDFKDKLCVKDKEGKIEIPRRLDMKDIRSVIAGVDWGTRNPACLVVLAIMKDNKVFVIDEFYKPGITSHEFAKIIRKYHDDYNFETVYIDPSALDLKTQVKDLHIPVSDNTDNDVENGITKIQSMFKNDMLYFDWECKYCISEHKAYQYEKDKATKNQTEKPLKKDDHACDAVRYGLSNFKPFRESSGFGFGHWSWRR